MRNAIDTPQDRTAAYELIAEAFAANGISAARRTAYDLFGTMPDIGLLQSMIRAGKMAVADRPIEVARAMAHQMIRDAHKGGGLRAAREVAQQQFGPKGYILEVVTALRQADVDGG